MFKDMKTATKIMLGFGLAIAIALAIGISSYVGIGKLNSGLMTVSDVSLPGVQSLSQIDAGMLDFGYGLRGLLINRYGDEKTRGQQFARIEGGLKKADDGIAVFDKLPRSDKENALWKEFQTSYNEWKKISNDLVSIQRDKDKLTSAGIPLNDPRVVAVEDKSFETAKPTRELMLTANARLTELIKTNVTSATDARNSAIATGSSVKTLVIVAILVGALVLIGLAVFISRGISQALATLVGQAKDLTMSAVDGQLEKRGDKTLVTAEFQPIIAGFNDVLDALIEPLQVAVKYIAELYDGRQPEKITAAYKGDFNKVKNGLNQLIDVIHMRNGDIQMLTDAFLGGKLDIRADTKKYAGDNGKMIEGINKMMDVVVAPINEASDVLSAAADRDLTRRCKSDYQGRFGELMENINRAIMNLDEALGQVAQSTEQVSSASNQIASGSQSLAEGANEQASALEEISSSLEQMSSMTKQNADNAGQAKVLSHDARTSADKGNEAMSRMSQAIAKIKASSDDTAKIIKTIDEIAFQTNLLALNAAVEAARAGEAGKGFAVVAEEVRNLAQRSAEAAKNTANMIEESVKNSEGGVRISEEVANILGEIVNGSGKVTNLIAEIAAASEEQANGIEQINTGVADMNKVTQQNAANSEESASAAEELSGQSEQLSAMIRSFKISSAVQESHGSSRHMLAGPRRDDEGVHIVVKDDPSARTMKAGKPSSVLAHKTLKGAPHHSRGNGSGPRPEEVIPLSDDELKDF